MYAQSEALPDSLALIARLAQTRKVFMATLNNESRELNLHRIEKFGLRRYFSVFFSSCYLGVTKPHPQIYRLALDLSQRQPQECVFHRRPLAESGMRAEAGPAHHPVPERGATGEGSAHSGGRGVRAAVTPPGSRTFFEPAGRSVLAGVDG